MFGFGWLPDTLDGRDWSLRQLREGAVMAPSPLPQPEMRHLAPLVRYQGRPGSCFGFALRCALVMGGRLTEDVSPGWLYYAARAQVYAGATVPSFIADVGSYPRIGLKACQSVGYCLERDYPYAPDEITRPPTAGATLSAFPQRGLRYARLDSSEQTAAALMGGMPVIFALMVDAPFLSNGGEVISTLGSPVGGHMLAVVAVTDEGVVFQNSWGLGWGRDGYGVISHDCFDSHAQDIYSLAVSP